MIVKLFRGSDPTGVVPPLDPTATAPINNGSVSLVSGKYVFNGVGYDCTQPGLYRFWNGGNSAIQSRLCYTPAGLYDFLSGMSWHHIHGVEDEKASYQLIANGGMTRKWRLRCGYIVGLAHWYLQSWANYLQSPIQSRSISVRTLGPLNGIDDGHVVLEVFHENKWKMWDLTNGVYWTLGGVHLSTAEIISAGILNCSRVHIDADSRYGASLAGSFCLGSYADMALLTPDEIDAWFARIFQAWTPS